MRISPLPEFSVGVYSLILRILVKRMLATLASSILYTAFCKSVMVGLREELTDKKTPYQDLPIDYQVYESFITSMLYSNGIIIESAIDTSDATYIAWTDDEVISLNEYLNYVIAKNWIDVTKLDLSSQYSDSPAITSSFRVKKLAYTSFSFSPALCSVKWGYTGKISQEELTTLKEKNPKYDLNDTVGKSGIEYSMESELQAETVAGTQVINDFFRSFCGIFVAFFHHIIDCDETIYYDYCSLQCQRQDRRCSNGKQR